jgi:poly(hydroxyalkanoate) depolymerase family esterase
MYLRNSKTLLSGAESVSSGSRLQKYDLFGSNPGNLNAWLFVPDGANTRRLPLVVVLHGCTQTAQGYDNGSGWSELAEAYGFAVLFPEQRRANNPNLCFNWFEPAHTRRDAGEALSIAQMIEAAIDRYPVDPAQVFVTGLSAGGAMTSVMLATYPEMFAGGAIMAGLPHGAAGSVQEAFQQMSAHKPSARTSGQSLKNASKHQGSWPAVSIWHGTADAVVSLTNADAIVRQWREVHHLPDTPTEDGTIDGYPRRAWRDATGKLLIEEYRVTGMGHGTPLSTTGECGCGQTGAFMLEAGISSTIHSARTWGLLGARRVSVGKVVRPEPASSADGAGQPHVAIKKVIEDALRAAGLMK